MFEWVLKHCTVRATDYHFKDVKGERHLLHKFLHVNFMCGFVVHLVYVTLSFAKMCTLV